MNKGNWGIKRVCLHCGVRFYDLGKSPILCPNCGKEFDVEYLIKKKTKLNDEAVVDEIDDSELEENDADISSEENISIDEAED